MQAEIEIYVDMEKPAHSDLDVLEWWKTNEAKLPLLAAKARRWLCVPATSASSERMFSAAGNNMTFSRYNLNPNTLKKLVFIHENMPRVHDSIKKWNLTYKDSIKFYKDTQQFTEADDSSEEEDTQDLDVDLDLDNEPSEATEQTSESLI
jgi:hypothetical protein